MRMKSVSGIVCLVSDLDASRAFYESLGFLFRKEVPGVSAHAYINWFWIELLLADKVVTETFKTDVDATQKGAGQYTHISVDDVDEFYKELLEKGLTPISEPQDYPWGNREFAIKDPDGYQLVFFKKK